MKHDQTSVPSPRRVRGAAMLEFAFVLPVLLVLFYGIVVYSIVFVTQQTVAHAANRGADAVARVNPRLDGAAFVAQATTQANQRVSQLTSFLLNGSQTASVCLRDRDGTLYGSCGPNAPQGNNDFAPQSDGAVSVRIVYPFASTFPALSYLPVPATISATGVARVDRFPTGPGT